MNPFHHVPTVYGDVPQLTDKTIPSFPATGWSPDQIREYMRARAEKAEPINISSPVSVQCVQVGLGSGFATFCAKQGTQFLGKVLAHAVEGIESLRSQTGSPNMCLSGEIALHRFDSYAVVGMPFFLPATSRVGSADEAHVLFEQAMKFRDDFVAKLRAFGNERLTGTKIYPLGLHTPLRMTVDGDFGTLRDVCLALEADSVAELSSLRITATRSGEDGQTYLLIGDIFISIPFSRTVEPRVDDSIEAALAWELRVTDAFERTIKDKFPAVALTFDWEELHREHLWEIHRPQRIVRGEKPA